MVERDFHGAEVLKPKALLVMSLALLLNPSTMPPEGRPPEIGRRLQRSDRRADLWISTQWRQVRQYTQNVRPQRQSLPNPDHRPRQQHERPNATAQV